MRAAPPLLFALCCLAAPASADTLLSLSNTATVSAQPDELDATLRAQAEGGSASEVQQDVNRAIAAALGAAKAVSGVRTDTGQYSVWTNPPASNGQPQSAPWHATQGLELRGHDGAAMLALVGKLQQQGLAVEQLGWRLSDEAERTAHEAALRKAVEGLRSRAETMAGLLGLHFASFRTVHVGTPQPSPFPVPMRAMVATAAAAPPPSAENGPVTVSATVTAEAVLVAQSQRDATPR